MYKTILEYIIKNGRCNKNIQESYIPTDVLNKFIDLLRTMHKQILGDQALDILGCYSYDTISNIVKISDLDKEYLLYDTHILDYMIDYFYYFYNPTKENLDFLFYKYVCEQSLKNKDISYFYWLKLQDYIHLEQGRHINKLNEILWNQIHISGFFVSFHEMTHITPHNFASNQFYDLIRNKDFNNLIKSSYSKEMLTKIEKEIHCDFNALTIMLIADAFQEIFNSTKQEIFEICLITLSGLMYFDLLRTIAECEDCCDTNDNLIFARIRYLVFITEMSKKTMPVYYSDIDTNRSTIIFDKFIQLWKSTSKLMFEYAPFVDEYQSKKNKIIKVINKWSESKYNKNFWCNLSPDII